MVEQIFIISFSFDVYLAYILHYNYISNNSSSYFKHYFSHFRIKFKLYNNSTETWQTLLCHFKKCLYHHKEKQHRTEQTFSAMFYSIAPILYLVNLNKISKKTCREKIFFLTLCWRKMCRRRNWNDFVCFARISIWLCKNN